MELVHDFTVPVPAAQAWDLLQDIQQIAPCLPGAAVTSVDGDTFEGGMKIKVGPIGMTFKGGGRFLEKNEADHRAVLEAKGRDAKGNGGAQATVTATLHEHNGVTDVHVVTDMIVSGKAAQFGGGVMKDVSNKMLSTFASNLSQLIESGGAQPVSTSAATAGPDVGPVTTAASTEQGTAPSNQSKPTFVPDDSGVDALSLLLGSESFRKAAKPLIAAAGGILVGYLYGKNRTLERMLKRV